MDSSKLKISIIVVNYKGREYLQNCLSSIFDNPPRHPFEVILVDNASGDDSVEFVSKNFSQVKVIRNKYNYGFAMANNQGFQISAGEYVMTLNPDAQVVGNSLDAVVDVIDSKKEIGIIAPFLLEDSGPVVVYDGYRLISPFRTFNRLAFGASNFRSELPKSLKAVSWIWGTGYVCRRAALGGYFFDDRTFLFAEEQEICTRVRRNGFTVAVCPEFLIQHIGSVTYSKDQEKSAMARRLLEAACWMHRKDLMGQFWANTHQLFRALDDSLMCLILGLKGLMSEHNEGREMEISNLKANIAASINLIFKGEAYFQRINKEARVFFNNGVDVPFPPETY